MLILGLESSCEETGVALIDDKKGLLAHAVHTQIDMHKLYGGVVPELASQIIFVVSFPWLNKFLRKQAKLKLI